MLQSIKRRTFLLAAGAAGFAPRLVLGAAETGVFERKEPAGANDTPQQVFFHRPAAWRPDARIVMVMHGLARNAERYRDDWIWLADRHGFLLVCPEFSAEKFPGNAWYNYGGLHETADPQLRAFAVLDRVFADVRSRLGATAPVYSVYGHSAGAQFVHRYLLLAPSPFVAHAIAANAGWYTLPVFDQPFPYGLRGTPVTESEVGNFLRKPLVLLLGESDTNPRHRTLRRDASADRQGEHRFARGLNYMAVGRREAARLGVSLAWQLATVPNVGHSNGRMAESAAAALFS